MLLNDIIMGDKSRMTQSSKRDVIRVFPYLSKEDQDYIIDNLKKFVPTGTIFMIPLINQAYPKPFILLVNTINIRYRGEYFIKFYDIAVDPAHNSNALVLGSEYAGIYQVFGRSSDLRPVLYNILNTIDRRKLLHLSDFFDLFMDILDITKKYAVENISYYPDIVLGFSRICDIITRLNPNLFTIEDVHPMEIQALAFSNMMKSLQKDPTNAKYATETALIEINLYTSLIKPERLFDFDCGKVLATELLFTGDENDKNALSKYVYNTLLNFKDVVNPFRISMGHEFPKIRDIQNFIVSPARSKNEEDIKHLIEYITKDKVKELIDDKTGVIEDLNNISFAIPEELVAMYQYEFGKDSPLVLVPVTKNMEILNDGCNWRHIIYYGDKIFVAIYLKETKDKLYGITFDSDNGKDTSCSIIEFTGKGGASYRFEY